MTVHHLSPGQSLLGCRPVHLQVSVQKWVRFRDRGSGCQTAAHISLDGRVSVSALGRISVCALRRRSLCPPKECQQTLTLPFKTHRCSHFFGGQNERLRLGQKVGPAAFCREPHFGLRLPFLEAPPGAPHGSPGVSTAAPPFCAPSPKPYLYPEPLSP